VYKKNIHLDLVIEAGAHDGKNTRKLVKLFPDKRFVLIEPDNAWVDELTSIRDDIQVVNCALGDKNTTLYLYSPFEQGSFSGNLVASEKILSNLFLYGTTESRTLDSLQVEKFSSGLIWMNIMGSTHQVLLGSKLKLKSIEISIINVNFRKMYDGRESNFFRVLLLCLRSGMMPIYIELNRKNFGWLVCIKSKQLNFLEKLKSGILLLLGGSLHLAFRILPARLE